MKFDEYERCCNHKEHRKMNLNEIRTPSRYDAYKILSESYITELVPLVQSLDPTICCYLINDINFSVIY